MGDESESPAGDTARTLDGIGSRGANADVVARSVCSFEAFERRRDGDGYRILFDGDVDRPSTAVVDAVAAISGTDHTDVEQLYSAVDPDALDALVSPRVPSGGDVRVTLTLDGYDVTVRSYGSIEVRPAIEEAGDD